MTGNISFGIALVAGRNRVPRPPIGNIALRTGFNMSVALGPKFNVGRPDLDYVP